MNTKSKILLVDDKIENLVALEALLADLDVEFVRATSGNEALKKTLKNEFALALIDVKMPGMDGYETVELIRQQKKTEHLPVIFLSATYKEDYHKVKGIQTGAVDFITKPINPEILIGKVRVFLNLYNHKISLQKAHDELELRVEERTDELFKANKELEKHKEHLEELVKGRTAELAKTNEQLEQQIEERKRVEEQLLGSELWLQSIFNSLEEAVFVVTADRILVNVNDAAKRMFGYSEEELRNLSTEVVHVDHEHYLEFGRRIKEAFDQGKTANFEFKTKRKNGEVFPTEHTVSLLKSKQGKALGIVSVVRDITQRKEAEDALEKRTGELRTMVNAMAGREIRMAELKEVIRKLRAQLEETGLTPVADDPLKAMTKETDDGPE